MKRLDKSPVPVDEETYYIVASVGLVLAAGLLWLAAIDLGDADWEKPLTLQWTSYRPILMAGVIAAVALLGASLVMRIREAESRRREALQGLYTRELQDAYTGTLHALAAALDLRDTETWGHSRRVLAYSLAIGRKLGLNRDEMGSLAWGALLHDMGKLGIPDSILFKSGPLSVAERRKMNEHVEVGYRLVSTIPHLRQALDVIRYHHERFDGQGYPERLRGSDIPLVARIFAVADAFDAMTSVRPYRRQPLTLVAARAELQENAGSQLDPQTVAAFCGLDDSELQRIHAQSFMPLTDIRQFLFQESTDIAQLQERMAGTLSRESWEHVRSQMVRMFGWQLGGLVVVRPAMAIPMAGLRPTPSGRPGQPPPKPVMDDNLLGDVGFRLSIAAQPDGVVYRFDAGSFLIWFPMAFDPERLRRQLAAAAEILNDRWRYLGAHISLPWGQAVASQETGTIDDLLTAAWADLDPAKRTMTDPVPHPTTDPRATALGEPVRRSRS